MVHQGGVTSKTSRALANVRQQLKTKKTRGRNPRDLTDKEVTLLRNKQDSLLCQLKANAVDRAEGQRRRQRDLKAKAKLLHERLQRALQNNARVEQDLRPATEAGRSRGGRLKAGESAARVTRASTAHAVAG